MKPPSTSPPEPLFIDGRDRKAEHLELALDERMQAKRSYFDDFHFDHVALPEIDYDAIDTHISFLGKVLAAPLLISSMTGGTAAATTVNRHLAKAAETAAVALGVGSQRKALEDPDQERTFQIREVAPSIPLLANLGAVQLNYGVGIQGCRRVIKMIDADALIFHLNPLQEAIQPEGQRNFSELLPKLKTVLEAIETPIIVKEIGCGISGVVAEKLASIGIRIIDVAGIGGTSWARIEGKRAGDLALGDLFAEWGLPTPEAVRQVRAVPGLTIIGSGGIRNGLDAAKAIALGADLVGMAASFLPPALTSAEAVVSRINRFVRELKTVMFCVGAPTIDALKNAPITASIGRRSMA